MLLYPSTVKIGNLYHVRDTIKTLYIKDIHRYEVGEPREFVVEWYSSNMFQEEQTLSTHEFFHLTDQLVPAGRQIWKSIIISPSFGTFVPSLALYRTMRSHGITKDWGLLSTRFNKNIVSFVKATMKNDFRSLAYLGEDPYHYLTVVPVNIAMRWTIDTNNGAESIRYLESTRINEEFNYCVPMELEQYFNGSLEH